MAFIGAHVSISKGIHTVFETANKIGANALAFFVSSPRRWSSHDLAQKEIDLFSAAQRSSDFDIKKIVVHGSYLINLVSDNSALREKSYLAFINELKKCEMLGIQLYTFHPGSCSDTCLASNALVILANTLNRAIKETNFINILIETMVILYNLGRAREYNL